MHSACVLTQMLTGLYAWQISYAGANSHFPFCFNRKEKFEIIDGQHRFTAIKELGLPLFYTVRKGWAIKQVQVANSNTKGWTINDIVESQSELGNPNYIAIRDFCKPPGNIKFTGSSKPVPMPPTSSPGRVVATL